MMRRCFNHAVFDEVCRNDSIYGCFVTLVHTLPARCVIIMFPKSQSYLSSLQLTPKFAAFLPNLNFPIVHILAGCNVVLKLYRASDRGEFWTKFPCWNGIHSDHKCVASDWQTDEQI